MSLELGLIFAFAIIAFGGTELAWFVIWLRQRDNDSHHTNDSLKYA